jgi:hypothetical protein
MQRFALAVVFVLLLAGCGGGDESSESSGIDPATSTAQCEPQSGASVSKKASPELQDRPMMYLTDVEIEIEDCVERVTFKFKESKPGPGYDVSYQAADIATKQDGSGKPLAIAGEDFLVVRMFPVMTAEIDGEDVKPTNEGPRNIPVPGEASMIQQLTQTGDFEAQVTWAIGLDSEHPFTVMASDDELVVEISNVAASS